MCEELCQTSRTESFHVYLVVFIYFVCLFVSHLNTNLHPLHLFRRMLQRYLAVKLQRCFMDEETSQLSLIFWVKIFARCKQGLWTSTGKCIQYLAQSNMGCLPEDSRLFGVLMMGVECSNKTAVFLGKIPGGCEGHSK